MRLTIWINQAIHAEITIVRKFHSCGTYPDPLNSFRRTISTLKLQEYCPSPRGNQSHQIHWWNEIPGCSPHSCRLARHKTGIHTFKIQAGPGRTFHPFIGEVTDIDSAEVFRRNIGRVHVESSFSRTWAYGKACFIPVTF